MSTRSIREILERVGKRLGADWFAIVIPILEDLFAAILEECVTTEEEAVDLVTDPTPLQAVIMHHQVVKAMRRQGDNPRRGRRARAWQVIFAVIDEANADPKAVCAAFNEVTA